MGGIPARFFGIFFSHQMDSALSFGRLARCSAETNQSRSTLLPQTHTRTRTSTTSTITHAHGSNQHLSLARCSWSAVFVAISPFPLPLSPSLCFPAFITTSLLLRRNLSAWFDEPIAILSRSSAETTGISHSPGNSSVIPVCRLAVACIVLGGLPCSLVDLVVCNDKKLIANTPISPIQPKRSVALSLSSSLSHSLVSNLVSCPGFQHHPHSHALAPSLASRTHAIVTWVPASLLNLDVGSLLC